MIQVIGKGLIDEDARHLEKKALKLYIDGFKTSANKIARQSLLLEDAAVIYREVRLPNVEFD